MTRAEKAIRNEQMRAYKATGKTNREVAERFGTTEACAAGVCKGIASQSAKGYKNLALGPKAVEKKYKDEYSIQTRLEEYAGRWEYAGNYTGADGYVDIRCVKCGTIRNTRCSVFRNHYAIHCKVCRDKERADREQWKKEEREHIKAEKKAERLRIEQEKREARRHPCIICGTMTLKPKYCCKTCARKTQEKNREISRRVKIQSNLIDRDITLKKLYQRDKGRCYICGLECSYDDYIRTDTAFIAGDFYPSIDHVVPLSRGGKHSWDNVRLAHRRCNTAKRDIPPDLYLSGA